MVKIIKILERELIHGMRLLGTPTVNDLTPEMVGYLSIALAMHANPFFQVQRVDWQPALPNLAKL